ncbi:MAG: arsenate reductase ArsC [Lewinella sp.]|nr:arsenate reductase ArsC [Lewinella sp.]
MAEGYLSYFGQGQLEVQSAGLDPRGVHPLAIEVMQADNLDISNAESKDVERFSGEEFDYLITVCDNAEQHLPSDLYAEEQVHYSIPDPEQFTGTEDELREAFCDTREEVKRSMLQFVGQFMQWGLTG